MLQPLTPRRIATILCLAVVVSPLTAVPAGAQSRGTKVQQEQLPYRGNSGALGVEQVTPHRSSQSSVEQIPSDGVVTSTQGDGSEAAAGADPAAVPGAGQAGGQRGAVYTAMASAWTRLRSRGQQPTPELMSQEVGPDSFNMFLNMFPGSELIFAIDSDQFPLKIEN